MTHDRIKRLLIASVFLTLASCATTGEVYRDPNMDFGSIKTIAVLPFSNLSRDNLAGERVRDVFSNMLLATGAAYVVPQGEVARGISRAGITNPTAPSVEDMTKLAGIIKADAVITGVVREYGEVRSANSAANVISLSLQMYETQTGRQIWSATSTKGGISMLDRLFGGGGRPMNKVTEDAVNELLNKLFK